MHRRLATSVTLLVLTLGLAAPNVLAAPPASILTADLDGRSISTSEIADHYCHDLDWPAIHCYLSADELEVAATRADPRTHDESMSGLMSVSAVAYIRVYSLSAYAGTYIILSADYVDLAVIGWSNRISSYVGLNNETSRVYTSTYYSGSTFPICCNQHSAVLSSTFDNKIRSIERT